MIIEHVTSSIFVRKNCLAIPLLWYCLICGMADFAKCKLVLLNMLLCFISFYVHISHRLLPERAVSIHSNLQEHDWYQRGQKLPSFPATLMLGSTYTGQRGKVCCKNPACSFKFYSLCKSNGPFFLFFFLWVLRAVNSKIWWCEQRLSPNIGRKVTNVYHICQVCYLVLNMDFFKYTENMWLRYTMVKVENTGQILGG